MYENCVEAGQKGEDLIPFWSLLSTFRAPGLFNRPKDVYVWDRETQLHNRFPQACSKFCALHNINGDVLFDEHGCLSVVMVDLTF
jgi:hypothetical protein